MGIGLALFVLAMTLPWLSVNLGPAGQFGFTLVDLYRFVVQPPQAERAPATTPSDISATFRQYAVGIIALLASLMFYPAAAVVGAIGLALRRYAAEAGGVGLASVAAWVVAVEALKTASVQQGGGVVAFGVTTLVTIGLGPYLAVAGAILMLVTLTVSPS
jgi:hypothetical protein